METITWLVILIIMLITEIITLGLTTIWFAGGAFIAFLAAVLGAPLIVQIILFLVVSLVLLWSTRPIAVKYINKSRTKTNIEGIIGMTGIVTEDINNNRNEGLVNLNGQIWTARTLQENICIVKDAKVLVAAIKGVKLIVEEKKEDD